MDTIRDHLMYKNTPLAICLATLTPQEQYECVRILLESKSTVSICIHDTTNDYIIAVLKTLKVQFHQCWVTEQLVEEVKEPQ